jgi:hypothetical protein
VAEGGAGGWREEAAAAGCGRRETREEVALGGDGAMGRRMRRDTVVATDLGEERRR